MQMEDAIEFRDGLREFAGAVGAGDDEFRLRAIEVRTPIRNDAIGAYGRGCILVSPFSPVADDRVEWRLNGLLVHHMERRIIRVQAEDAVGKFQLAARQRLL